MQACKLTIVCLGGRVFRCGEGECLANKELQVTRVDIDYSCLQ